MPVDSGPPDDFETNLKWLLGALPETLDSDEGGGNSEFLEPVANQFDALDDDIEAVDGAVHVQTAPTIAHIARLSKMADTVPYEDESLERFRARTKIQYLINTSEGTIENVLTAVSDVLDVNIKEIEYSESSGHITIGMPKSAVDGIPLTASDIAELLADITAATCEVSGVLRGTLEYVTPETYNNTTDWPTDGGYTTVDANGKRIDSGGTYAGVIESSSN